LIKWNGEGDLWGLEETRGDSRRLEDIQTIMVREVDGRYQF
jgi:hypothetical protein